MTFLLNFSCEWANYTVPYLQQERKMSLKKTVIPTWSSYQPSFPRESLIVCSITWCTFTFAFYEEQPTATCLEEQRADTDARRVQSRNTIPVMSWSFFLRNEGLADMCLVIPSDWSPMLAQPPRHASSSSPLGAWGLPANWSVTVANWLPVFVSVLFLLLLYTYVSVRI